MLSENFYGMRGNHNQPKNPRCKHISIKVDLAPSWFVQLKLRNLGEKHCKQLEISVPITNPKSTFFIFPKIVT